MLQIIKKFQESNLTITEQINLLNDVKNNLESEFCALEKLENCLKKNPGLVKLTSDKNSDEFKFFTKCAISFCRS